MRKACGWLPIRRKRRAQETGKQSGELCQAVSNSIVPGNHTQVLSPNPWFPMVSFPFRQYFSICSQSSVSLITSWTGAGGWDEGKERGPQCRGQAQEQALSEQSWGPGGGGPGGACPCHLYPLSVLEASPHSGAAASVSPPACTQQTPRPIGEVHRALESRTHSGRAVHLCGWMDGWMDRWMDGRTDSRWITGSTHGSSSESN